MSIFRILNEITFKCGSLQRFQNKTITNKAVPSISSLHFSSTSSKKAESSVIDSVRSPAQISLQEQLEVIDRQVQRWGRVDRHQIKACLDSINKSDFINSNHALMFLRCTGSLMVKENSAYRHEVFQKAWNLLGKKNVDFDTHHYNAALRVQLENDQKIDITNFLQDMGNISPNRITYQLLIAAYCENGDIEGAKTVLEHMKLNKIPINEMVFNSLIKGYIKTGDEENADKIMENMKILGIEPSPDTFKVMMTTYAESGNMDGIEKAIREAESQGHLLHPRFYLQTLTTLAIGNHQEHVNSIFHKLIPLRMNYFHDATNALYTLIAGNQVTTAIRILDLLAARLDDPEKKIGLCRMFIKNMCQNNQSLDTILKSQDTLEGKFGYKEGLTELLELAKLTDRPDLAIELFPLMKKEGIPIDSKMFRPCLDQFKRFKDHEGSWSGLKCLTETLPPGERLGTAYYHILAPLAYQGVSIADIDSRLKTETSLDAQEINIINAILHLAAGDFDEHIKICEESKADIPYTLLKSEMKLGIQKKFDIDGLMKFLKFHQPLKDQHLALNYHAIETVISKKTNFDIPMSKVVDKIIEHNIHLDQNAIKNLEEKAGISKESFDKLLKRRNVGEGDATMKTVSDLLSMSLSELEDLKKKFRESNIKTKTIDKLMLHELLRTGVSDKANALKSELEEEGYEFMADTLRHLALHSAKYERNLEKSTKYINELTSKYPDFKAYESVMLYMAILHLKENNYDDAFELIQSYALKHPLVKPLYNPENRMAIEQLLGLCVETCSKSVQEGLLNLLVEHGYIKRGTSDISSLLIQSHLIKEDYDGAIAVLEDCAREKKLPLFSKLMTTLAKNEDSERLQKVVDLVSMVLGELITLNHLFISLVEIGKVKEAQMVISAPGMRLLNNVLRIRCNELITERKEDELKMVLKASKDQFGTIRDHQLFYLIKYYCLTRDTPNAMQVLLDYEEENISPSDRTLRYLGKYLQSNREEVPFTIPPIADEDSAEGSASNLTETNALQLIQSGKMQDSMSLLQKNYDKGEKLSNDFVRNVVNFLVQKSKFGELKSFLHNSLAMNGDIKMLNIAKDNLKNFANLMAFVDSRKFLAAIHSDKLDDFFSDVEKDSFKLDFTTTPVLQQLSEKSPSHFESLIVKIHSELSKDLSDLNVKAGGHLFNYYILNNDYSSADNLVKVFPLIASNVRIGYILKELNKTNDETSMLRFLELCKNHHDKDGVKVKRIYSGLIKMKADSGDWQSALDYVDQAQADHITPDLLWNLAIEKLEALLITNNQPVPWSADALKVAVK